MSSFWLRPSPLFLFDDRSRAGSGSGQCGGRGTGGEPDGAVGVIYVSLKRIGCQNRLAVNVCFPSPVFPRHICGRFLHACQSSWQPCPGDAAAMAAQDEREIGYSRYGERHRLSLRFRCYSDKDLHLWCYWKGVAHCRSVRFRCRSAKD